MRVQTFVSKLSVESLANMDQHINEWLEKNKIEPKRITQATGTETGRSGRNDESVVIVSIWY